MNRLSTKAVIAVFFLVAFSFIGFFVLVTYKNMRQTQVQNSKTNNSLHLLQLTEKILTHLEELEAAQRSDFLPRGENPAEACSRAASALLTNVHALARASENDPSRKAQGDRLNLLVQKKIADVELTIASAKTKSSAAASEIPSTEEGKKISDEIKTVIFEMEDIDHAIINQANQYLKDIAEDTTQRFFLLAFIFFVILFIFLLIIFNDFKRTEKIQAKLSYQASLIETIPDAIFTTDENLIVKTWNKFATSLYGFSEAEAIGKPVTELFSVDRTEEEKQQSLAMLQEYGSFKDEYSIQRKNKDSIFVLASINTIVNNDGNITGYVAVHRNITERKKLEDRQKQFNRELEKQVNIKTAETKNILERITDGFLALDSNLTFTYVNKKAGEMLGHRPEDMIGKNIFTGFPETGSQLFNNACAQSLRTQQYVFLENHYGPLNTWLENDIYPSPDGLSVFFKDSTYKKISELALKESEERYRYLLEHIHAGVVVHLPDTSIILCNQEASRLLGIEPGKILGKKASEQMWKLVWPDGKEAAPEEYPMMQVITTGKPVSNVIACIDRSNKNERIWVLVNAFPEFDEAMQLKQVVVTFVDITEGKKVEQELKRSEDELNMAQEIARMGSWEFNMLTNELKWSNELYRIFELEGTPPDKLYEAYRNKYHPEDIGKLDKMVEYAIREKKGYRYQHRIISNNGTIKHILGNGEVILNAAGEVTGLKGTGQDITDIIKAEEKLQNSFRQIKQLVTHLQDIREEERANMAREIHDELGQQLTGLKMYVSWLNKKVTMQESDIREKFTAAMELIEDTIKSVRKISMDLRPSMLDDLGLLATMEWQTNEFEKRSGIVTKFINLTENIEIPARLKTGLFRIYQESLTNVARHAEAKKIVSSLKYEDNSLVLTITDDGKGFAFKNIESKKTLGLFGMKERTMEMGGKYEIISEPGQGTTVSVRVPINI